MGQLDINEIQPIDEDSGLVVALKDLTGQPERGEPTITVAGTYSRRFKNAQHQLASRSHRGTLEQSDANALALEAACIIAWDFVSGGNPVPITVENWTAIAAQRPQWREQVQLGMVDHVAHEAARQARRS